jgi:spermidine synthase
MNAPVMIQELPIHGTPYRIVDLEGFRHLMVNGDDAAMHSKMLLSAPDELVSVYVCFMLYALPFAPRLDDILLIGLGGGQQTKFLHRRLPATRLVTVEIDPDIVRIARTYFNVPADDDRLKVVVDDGGSYIAAHARSCDVLVCDGYDQTFDLPDSLAGEEFYGACERALRPGGVMALNLHCRSDAWRAAHLGLLERIFSSHIEVPVNENQSVLLLFKDEQESDYAAIRQRADALEEILELDLPAFFNRVE